ncbi:MAG: YaeQ family protein [Halopseudomonas sp.]
MAKGSRIYKVKLFISDMDRHCYEQLDLTVAQHPSESIARLLARLIALGLEYEPGLKFGGGVSSDEAPIWLRNDYDEVQHWIEIGQPDVDRLGKLNKRHPKLSLYSYGANAHRWWNQHSPALSGLARLKMVQLDHEALEQLAKGLTSGFEMQLNRQDDALYLGLNDQQAEMTLSCLQQGWQQ